MKEQSNVTCAQVYHHGQLVLTGQQFLERFVNATDGRVYCGENSKFASTYASQFGLPVPARALREPLNSRMLIHNANVGQQVRRAHQLASRVFERSHSPPIAPREVYV